MLLYWSRSYPGHLPESGLVSLSFYFLFLNSKIPSSFRLILGFLSAVVGLCTAYDYILQNRHKPENSPFVKSLSKASPYQPYILTFSAWSNTVSLFSAKSGSSSRLDVVGAIMLAFVLLEFVARSYVLPSFYGMMNVKRLQNGMPREFFTDRKFIFVRTAIFAACTYVMA